MVLQEFLKQYGTDEQCLEKIKQMHYPDGVFCEKCQKITNFTKVVKRPVYQCSCGWQISPLAGTIYHKTTTPLTLWFYAIFLVTSTRSGISAKQLQREIGVTYKTAWRMMKQIRLLMGYGKSDKKLRGTVEVDESFFGGKGHNRRYVGHYNEKPKTAIMGMVERGGNVVMKKIPNTGKQTLIGQVQQHIDPSAFVMHDQWGAYKNLHHFGYKHDGVDHGKAFVKNKVVHTENIEGLWGRIKPAVTGVYRYVSEKYIEHYMDEYCFRYNNRKLPTHMFNLVLQRVSEVSYIPAK